MIKRKIVIDITNPYVRSLMMAFEHFMLEECAGYARSELRLLKEIQKCKCLLDNERMQLVERSRMPIYFDTEKNEWRCFKKCNLIKIA